MSTVTTLPACARTSRATLEHYVDVDEHTGAAVTALCGARSRPGWVLWPLRSRGLRPCAKCAKRAEALP